jgi:hypothetical protein
MSKMHKIAWILWIGGTVLIVGSWTGFVPNEIGWAGFCVALGGTVLSTFSYASTERGTRSESQFLCDECKMHHGNVCDRPERPNALECPDFLPLGKRW